MDKKSNSYKEDQALKNIIKKIGNSNWPKLAKEMKKKEFNKSEKQCQERLF